MINILFTCDENYAIYLNVAIVSILKNANKNDEFEFFIMHPDLSIKTKTNIEKFKKIHNFKINFIQIDLEKELEFYSAKGVWHSKMCFLRIKAPLILRSLGYNLDKLLYLDADIIVNKSLNDLFEADLKNHEIAAVASPIAEEEEKHIPILNLNKNHKYFYSGLILFNIEKYIENKIYENSIDLFNKSNKNFLWPDMDLLNITFDNNYLILEPKYSINPLFNYEPFTHKLKNYYRIYQNIYSKEDVKEAFENPVIYQLAGGAKPNSRVCNFMTVILFYRYAKLTIFRKEALTFIIKKFRVKLIIARIKRFIGNF